MGETISQIVAFYPTRVRLPLWARRNALTLRGALERLRISDLSVSRISSEFKPRMLMRPFLDPRLPESLDARTYLDVTVREVPTDGVEVVEWMQIAHADRLTLSARALEYNRAGSQLVYDNGDSYIPGVTVEDLRFRKESGSTVRTRGYGIADTPLGSFNLPTLKKSTGVFKDLISAATMSYCGSVQWTGNLLKWKELATTPIKQTVGFFSDARGNVAPNFFEQLPTRPKLTVTVRQTFSSNDAQTITMKFRDPTDYSRVLGTKTVDIPAGTSQVTWTMSAFPYVPPTVAEVQPQDETQTSLEEYVVV